MEFKRHRRTGAPRAFKKERNGGLQGTSECSLFFVFISQVKAKEARIRALAADPRIYDRLVASMAPNVWEMEDVKKGLMCQVGVGWVRRAGTGD